MRFVFVSLLMALSGAAALGWQFVWTEQLGSRLGHEIVAVLAVMAAFFAGLSLGALLLGRAIARTRWPGRWYVACEAVVLLWGLLLYAALPGVADAAVRLIGPEPTPAWHWSVAFALPLLLLLPATLAMGATLPAVERQWQGRDSAWGGLYAANTLGAVAGVLGVVFVLVPRLGLNQTGALCCALNALCALAAWWAWGRAPVAETVATRPSLPELTPSRRVAWLLALTGFLGIGYQVLAVRVLSQVTENTVFSYAIILAVYLLGTALGAAVYQRRFSRTAQPQRLLQRLLTGLAASVLVGGISLWGADRWCALPTLWFGPSAAYALAGEALAALLALLLPTATMGALFSHLCVLAKAQQGQHKSMGHAVAINTAGAALAPLAVGVWAVPALGGAACLMLLVAAYLALQPQPFWRLRRSYLLAACGVMWLALAGPLRFVDVPEGGHLLSYRDGVMAAVSVVRDGHGIAHLHINNRVQEGSSAGSPVEARLALLPLLLHGGPKSALYLGLGTGYTAKVAAADPSLQVDAVELLPEVVAAVHHFQGEPPARWTPPARVVAADARRYVQAGMQRYDVIVSDLFHPARNGAGALYTVEQFQAVRDRLAPDGLFCQWLAVHQMDLDTLRSIVAAFLKVYPQGVAVLASNSLDSPVLGLVARPGLERFDTAAVQARLAAFGNPRALQETKLTTTYAVLGSLLADPAALARFAAGAPANTDDHPVVTHAAPWATYAAQTTPRQRLLGLLDSLNVQAQAVLRQPGAVSDAITPQSLQAYWQARDRYLRLGAGVRPSGDPTRMLDQLQAPLLALLRVSPDFQPALDPLLALSMAVADTNPQRSRAILGSLHELYPEHRQIAAALGQLH